MPEWQLEPALGGSGCDQNMFFPGWCQEEHLCGRNSKAKSSKGVRTVVVKTFLANFDRLAVIAEIANREITSLR